MVQCCFRAASTRTPAGAMDGTRDGGGDTGSARRQRERRQRSGDTSCWASGLPCPRLSTAPLRVLGRCCTQPHVDRRRTGPRPGVLKDPEPQLVACRAASDPLLAPPSLAAAPDDVVDEIALAFLEERWLSRRRSSGGLRGRGRGRGRRRSRRPRRGWCRQLRSSRLPLCFRLARGRGRRGRSGFPKPFHLPVLCPGSTADTCSCVSRAVSGICLGFLREGGPRILRSTLCCSPVVLAALVGDNGSGTCLLENATIHFVLCFLGSSEHTLGFLGRCLQENAAVLYVGSTVDTRANVGYSAYRISHIFSMKVDSRIFWIASYSSAMLGSTVDTIFHQFTELFISHVFCVKVSSAVVGNDSLPVPGR